MFEDLFSQYQPNSKSTVEILTVHQLAQDFRLEVAYREQLEQHHVWYSQTCQQHQQELEAMAHEADVLAWFRQLWRPARD